MNFDKNIAKVQKQVDAQKRGGVRAHASATLAVLLMGTLAFAGGVGPGMWGRASGTSFTTAMAQAATGWSSNGTVITSAVTGGNITTISSAATAIRGGSGMLLMNDSTGVTLQYTGTTSLVQDSVTNTFTGPVVATSALTKGSKVLAAGTGTVTVASGAKCTCTNETTALAVRCPVVTTTLTITSGVGTDTVSYICL